MLIFGLDRPGQRTPASRSKAWQSPEAAGGPQRGCGSRPPCQRAGLLPRKMNPSSLPAITAAPARREGISSAKAVEVGHSWDLWES